MMSGVVTRLVPDLDDELTHALGQLEELLSTLAAWEDDPDAPLALPTPLAGRRALQALQRVAAAVLGRELATRPHSELVEAMEAGADAARGDYGQAPTPVQLVATLARVHGLLDLAITADTELLTARIAAAGRNDVVLTTAEAAAYQRIADRFNGMWALSDPLSRFLY
jgi:hypothetical protein